MLPRALLCYATSIKATVGVKVFLHLLLYVSSKPTAFLWCVTVMLQEKNCVGATLPFVKHDSLKWSHDKYTTGDNTLGFWLGYALAYTSYNADKMPVTACQY